MAVRQHVESALAQRLAELGRTVNHIAVAFIDVDHFKTINDRFGHPVGDVVLKMVARTLSNAMRPYDCLGRWGGEEFVAILPGVKPVELPGVAERMRALVESSSRSVSQGKIGVTVSVGACLAKQGESADSVIKRADMLMYKSKQAGRNRVTCNASHVRPAEASR